MRAIRIKNVCCCPDNYIIVHGDNLVWDLDRRMVRMTVFVSELYLVLADIALLITFAPVIGNWMLITDSGARAISYYEVRGKVILVSRAFVYHRIVSWEYWIYNWSFTKWYKGSAQVDEITTIGLRKKLEDLLRHCHASLLAEVPIRNVVVASRLRQHLNW